MRDLYQRVDWPDVQELMDEPWFGEEAILDTRDNAPLSSYLIPVERLKETVEEKPQILTLETFKLILAEQPFAEGILPNSPEGIFMTHGGGELRWIAVKGGADDWTVYCHWSTSSANWIRFHGDKVTNEKHIRRCVRCSDEVFKLYRY